jgi:energy-coupling factor transporter transmembrane protein EcfT
MAGKKQLVHSIHHLMTGLVLILKGIDKISHHHALLGGLILLFGLIILSFFVYTVSHKKHSEKLELVVHWFEALVSLFIAYILFKEGKNLLPYVFLLAALGFFIAIFIHYRKTKSPAKNVIRP